MRLFIAIELPDEAKEELRKAQAKLEGAKLTPAKEFHITLKFLGEVPDDKVEDIKNRLAEVKFKPYKTALNSTGFFGKSKRIRTVWADTKPEEETIKLEQEISKALPEYKEERKFTAHITIARIKYIKDTKALANSAKGIGLKNIEFNIDCFKLKKSTLTPQGPAYEDLESYPIKKKSL